MSRRLISVLVTVFTVMLFATGCNSDQKAVTESVEGFLNAMVANDMEKASQYATEDFMKSDTMKLMQPDYLADTFYSAMGIEKDDLDEKAQNAVNEYVKNVVDKAYKSFEIQDIKVQEETAAVTARITLGYNPDASSNVSDDTGDLINAYQTEHYDELITIYTEEGEKAMNKKIYNDLIPIVISKMQEALESSESSEEKAILSLVKKDGKWLVTDLEENRPGAAAGDTAAEAGDGNTAEEKPEAGETADKAAAAEATTQEETAK